jgi:hypothetical protein
MVAAKEIDHSRNPNSIRREMNRAFVTCTRHPAPATRGARREYNPRPKAAKPETMRAGVAAGRPYGGAVPTRRGDFHGQPGGYS